MQKKKIKQGYDLKTFIGLFSALEAIHTALYYQSPTLQDGNN